MKSKVKSEAAEKAPTAGRAPKRTSKLEKPEAKNKTTGERAKKVKAETRARSTKPAKRATATKREAETAEKAPKLLPEANPEVEIAAKTARARARTEESAPRTKKETVKPAGTKRRKNPAKPAEGADSYRVGEQVADPIGDTTDGEGRTYLGENEAQANAEVEEFRKDTTIAASDAILEAGPGMEAAAEAVESGARREAEDAAARRAGEGEDEGTELEQEDRGPAKLERLQKILSQAGVASRRRAEEMITAGRVMVNGQVVTTLGSKADPARDHIRVDGKLLHGAERHRYFVLNKPRGYVTTVSDPEGRPTVMDFVAKASERLYPVGRLDYQSEGLLLMTNDGELANLLTKAGSGVEKTYLVKVAGQPSEQELERLGSGVTIERAEEGSGRVRTAPARVRQVRVGDNPWFEVVLIEGRNRELRKMFAAVGHFVEKIRRVSYGPLVLDVEPGKLRELTPDEVNALRLTAEGKLKPRRIKVDRVLPKDAGVPAERRFGRGREQRDRGGDNRFDRGAGRGNKPGFGGRREGRPFSGPKPEFEKRSFDRPRFEKPRFDRPAGADGKPGFGGRGAMRTFSGPKPEFEKRSFNRPRFEKPASGGLHIEPEADRPGGFRDRPKFEGRKPFGGEKRPFGGGRSSSGAKREFGGPRGDRPRIDRTGADKPGFKKRGFEKRSFDRPRFDKPRFEKPGFGRGPGGPGGSGGQGGHGGQAEGQQEGGRRKPFRPQGDRPGGFKGPDNQGGAGRPRTGFGGRPGGFAKPNRPGSFKRPGKPGGGKRSGPRSGGGRSGGGNFGGRPRA